MDIRLRVQAPPPPDINEETVYLGFNLVEVAKVYESVQVEGRINHFMEQVPYCLARNEFPFDPIAGSFCYIPPLRWQSIPPDICRGLCDDVAALAEVLGKVAGLAPLDRAHIDIYVTIRRPQTTPNQEISHP